MIIKLEFFIVYSSLSLYIKFITNLATNISPVGAEAN